MSKAISNQKLWGFAHTLTSRVVYACSHWSRNVSVSCPVTHPVYTCATVVFRLGDSHSASRTNFDIIPRLEKKLEKTTYVLGMDM